MADPKDQLSYLVRLVRRKKARERALAETMAEHDEEIRRLDASGVPRAQLIKTTGLSPQRIDQIRKGPRCR